MLKKVNLIWIAAMFMLFVGCSNGQKDTSQEKEGTNPNPIRYETKEEYNARHGINDYADKDYYQSDEAGIAPDGNERNIFNTEESLLIAQTLQRKTDIKQAQAALVDSKIIVFVTLNDYTNDNISNNIRQIVQEIVPEKEVIIFTDEIHWNRMRHLQAGLKQREIAENLEHYFEENFNIRIKDE
ncbi:YhcN/YlaJ family sporulation lipoprotein [Virgibacillus sp. W0430]|uniref:YhcN/YlaJ family sporulation lipoprotein n=1 Tax=Virgibacillus sp. W0430 TaxID=3391580 RepID=UPI003F47B868